jgi:hypothetical protein
MRVRGLREKHEREHERDADPLQYFFDAPHGKTNQLDFPSVRKWSTLGA